MNERERLDTEEGQRKAETLFSRKFIEYLSSKKPPGTDLEANPPRKGDVSPSSEDTTASESSRKSGRKPRKKAKDRQQGEQSADYSYGYRSKMTQCSQLKNAEEVAPPEELKNLLLNMTMFLQQLKSPSEHENLHGLISRITILVTEFIRRPLKKTQQKKENAKSLDKTVAAILDLLDEYKDGSAMDSENGIREFKRIEREIAARDQEIADVKKKLSADDPKESQKGKDINARVRDSILGNEKLKADIRFNHGHIKKYKKILLEKEWTKHKLESDLSHLRKKMSKADLAEGKLRSPENAPKGVASQKLAPDKGKKEAGKPGKP